MSFILDALKKSEAERNRQSGPTLIDMRIAPPRRRLPLWIIALTVILLANFAVLAIVLLRSPSAEPSTALPTALPAPAAAVPAPATAPAQVASTPPPSNALPPPALVEAPAPNSVAMPTSPAMPLPGARPASGEEFSDLPSAEELRLEGVALPELRLALHVYDANPAVRYMLLNSQRMREGDSTKGIRLERITETGAVLSFGGRRFLLKPGQ